jgi:glycine oxidase
MLVPPSPHRRGPVSVLLRESLAAYPAFAEELLTVTGIDIEYERCGRMEICTTDQKYRMALSQVRASEDRRMPDGSPVQEMLSVDDARRTEPAIGCEAPGVLLCRESARLRNTRLLKALRRACDLAGVKIVEDAPVIELIVEGERVRGIQGSTETHRADRVVLCAGAWSSQLHPLLERRTPVFPSRGQAVLLYMSEPPFNVLIERARCYVARRRDGHIYLGATDEPEAGFDKHTTPAGVGGLMNRALEMIPALADASVVTMWSGLRPRTPDRRPYIGPVPGLEGLIAATGHYRNGLLLAPITARIVADLVLDGRTDCDLSGCLPGR